MREIKFRVWSDFYDDWIESFCIKDGRVHLGNAVHHPGNQVNDAILMQYTGLKDVHGKGIYEGDIVKNAFGEEYKIVWDEKRCQFIAVTTIEDGSEWYQNVNRSLEVIGNIYENRTK
ncbi:YopX family protein [Bacillus thuringiensis]|uniref:YopX protein domain-containing protein n=1 Tax=Bacillus thuringiensis HD-771 TaxID=1218175 RepID=A0A9W3P0D0_BACTU|nr:YopX family protein [Bacillus thuringiensis]AFQ19010.1 hypothetical protein BTG_28065 [Bacillus thuringiensis HD-771]MEB4891973.1 YopX family protein [Bacillus thuringiensis]MEC2472481.1 YopX family protein [Bacillus thuringiensis]MEC2560519.1 YopX family protein [Bacillus thuringiensis]MEC2641398.1 YopX family protein [Bacillus thuringiensis]